MQLYNAELNKRIYASHTPFFLSDNRLEEQITGDPSFEHVSFFFWTKSEILFWRYVFYFELPNTQQKI